MPVLQVPQRADRVLGLNMTQPLLNATGQVRWAFNNIVQPFSPPCTALASDIHKDPSWIQQHLAAPGYDGYLDAFVQVHSPRQPALII